MTRSEILIRAAELIAHDPDRHMSAALSLAGAMNMHSVYDHLDALVGNVRGQKFLRPWYRWSLNKRRTTEEVIDFLIAAAYL